MCLEVVWSFQTLSQDSVVINFAVDCEGKGAIVIDKRLGARINTDNAQSFVCKD